MRLINDATYQEGSMHLINDMCLTTRVYGNSLLLTWELGLRQSNIIYRV